MNREIVTTKQTRGVCAIGTIVVRAKTRALARYYTSLAIYAAPNKLLFLASDAALDPIARLWITCALVQVVKCNSVAFRKLHGPAYHTRKLMNYYTTVIKFLS